MPFFERKMMHLTLNYQAFTKAAAKYYTVKMSVLMFCLYSSYSERFLKCKKRIMNFCLRSVSISQK